MWTSTYTRYCPFSPFRNNEAAFHKYIFYYFFLSHVIVNVIPVELFHEWSQTKKGFVYSWGNGHANRCWCSLFCQHKTLWGEIIHGHVIIVLNRNDKHALSSNNVMANDRKDEDKSQRTEEMGLFNAWTFRINRTQSLKLWLNGGKVFKLHLLFCYSALSLSTICIIMSVSAMAKHIEKRIGSGCCFNEHQLYLMHSRRKMSILL